jgi:hypothetical protein
MTHADRIRHRTSTKQHSTADIDIASTDGSSRRGEGKLHNQKLHVSVWVRFIAIITLFTIIALSISSSSRIGISKAIIGVNESNPFIVTIVMPRSVDVINLLCLILILSIPSVGKHADCPVL